MAVLYAFDFDCTTVAQTADMWMMEYMPELRGALRKEWENSINWHSFRNRLAVLLHENGCRESDMRERLAGMSFLGGMGNVFQKIGSHPSAELIVTSDANVTYIRFFLESKGLHQAVNRILSNPADFDDTGKLSIGAYHEHSCKRCEETPHMCKGTIMRQVMAEKSYSKVVYVGDGENDICPSLQLSKNDHIVARKHYSLASALDQEYIRKQINASVHIMDFERPETESLLLSFLPE